MTDSLYETDFYTWTQRQADHLREGRFHLVDLANVVEEIETLGRSEASLLRSAYRLIAMHLLKTMIQPEKATRSWRTTIGRQRIDIDVLLRYNPGLKPRRAELFLEAYWAVGREAALETRRPNSRFPETPPFTVDDVESEDFWPASAP